MTTECHSVLSWRSPVFLSRQDSEVAMREVHHRRARVRPPHLGIAPEIADEHHLVQTGHDRHLPFASLSIRAMLAPCRALVAEGRANPQIDCSLFSLFLLCSHNTRRLASAKTGHPGCRRQHRRRLALCLPQPLQRQHLIDVEVALPGIALLPLQHRRGGLDRRRLGAVEPRRAPTRPAARPPARPSAPRLENGAIAVAPRPLRR